MTVLLTFHDVLIREHGSSLGRGESKIGKSHCGGEAEGDGEPAETAGDEAPNTLQCTVVSFLVLETPSAAMFKHVITGSHE